MPLHTWWTFVIATFFVSATPGPNMLHMLAGGIKHGVRATFFSMLGCGLAVFSVTMASALGVGALLHELPGFFDVLRWSGAVYLIYIGIRALWESAGALIDTEITTDLAQDISRWRLFKSGFAVGMSNPKLFLFATAFFPQFIERALPQPPQIAVLLTSFCIIDFAWYIVYAIGGSRLATTLSSPRMQKWMQRTIGILFALFGVVLLKYRP